MSISLIINDEEVESEEGMTILEAAEHNEIYIPRLCHHSSLGSSHGLAPVDSVFREDGEFRNDGSGPQDGYPGCRLCLVEIEGREGVFTSCDTIAENGLTVHTETEAVKAERKNNLADILRDHPHACLLCAQQEGCSRTQCSTNVPEDERCCPLLGHCELQRVSQYVGVREDLTKYVFKDLPKHETEPLFNRDHNLCVSCLRCVRACRDLRGLETLGYVYQGGKAVVGPTKSINYSESDCRFCGACAEVCPTGAITDKDLSRGEREDVLVPCIANCPAGIDIPRYIWHISEGSMAEAEATIRERLPFPNILGHLCFHPCEDECRRGELNQPMAICALKRFAAGNAGGTPTLSQRPPTGKNIAIVGSGPSGLTAAHYLALKGHGVTVFEADGKIGGMLRNAIPDYRLPPRVLDDELNMLEEFVTFKTETKVGVDVSLSDLINGFQAVLIGTGAVNSKRIPLEGNDLEEVSWGLDFLKDVKKNQITSIAGRVVVIGGGNVAIDVARTAIRLGAEEVQLACLESDDEMPAHDWEIEEAREEGVVMNTSWGPKRILGEGKVSGIELMKCTSVFDPQGRFAPTYDEDITKTIETDAVILAIGQSADFDFLDGVDTKGGAITVDEKMQTNTTGIFAVGEAVRGPSSVIDAVADGAAAASAIDKFLGGNGDLYGGLEPDDADAKLAKVKGFADIARVPVPKRPPGERTNSFEMIEMGYDENQARQEASRCLRCDLRLNILPVTLPPDKWLELTEENVSEVPAVEGVYQLLDEDKNLIVIKGSMDIQADLKEKLGSGTKARYFGFEPDPMYTKRESELMQQHLQQFGKMPEGDGEGDDLDDLF
jgi:NADPH-dependent glutamate synthase beta subunit-like oxidoreductase/Pyruvate/2-oxoacid:ferredoxin oxidoreductase delta subunit